MPAIKVYSGSGWMIPVEEAKVVKAYRCPFTGTIIRKKRDYVKHLSQLRQERMWENARRNRLARKLEDMRNQKTFDDVVRWIELNPEVFWQNGKQQSWIKNSQKQWDKIRDVFGIKITLLELKWEENVSNTHSCPFNGVTNWSREHGLPTGYPGWRGRIDFSLTVDPPGMGSDMLKGTGINTGSGGGGHQSRSYDVKFFEDDWPGLARTRNEVLIQQIKNEASPLPRETKYRYKAK